jgi:hypothetical protein
MLLPVESESRAAGAAGGRAGELSRWERGAAYLPCKLCASGRCQFWLWLFGGEKAAAARHFYFGGVKKLTDEMPSASHGHEEMR